MAVNDGIDEKPAEDSASTRVVGTLFEFFDHKGFTREKLAEVAEVTESAISQYRTGARIPSLPVFLRLGEFAAQNGYGLFGPPLSPEHFAVPPAPSVSVVQSVCDVRRMRLRLDYSAGGIVVGTPAAGAWSRFEPMGAMGNDGHHSVTPKGSFCLDSTTKGTIWSAALIVQPLVVDSDVADSLKLRKKYRNMVQALAAGSLRMCVEGDLDGYFWSCPLENLLLPIGMEDEPYVIDAVGDYALNGVPEFEHSKRPGEKVKELTFPSGVEVNLEVLPGEVAVWEGSGVLSVQATLVVVVRKNTMLGQMMTGCTPVAGEEVFMGGGVRGYDAPTPGRQGEPSAIVTPAAICNQEQQVDEQCTVVNLGSLMDEQFTSVITSSLVEGVVEGVAVCLPAPPKNNLHRYFSVLAELLSSSVVVNNAPFPTVIPVFTLELRRPPGLLLGVECPPAAVEIMIPHASKYPVMLEGFDKTAMGGASFDMWTDFTIKVRRWHAMSIEEKIAAVSGTPDVEPVEGPSDASEDQGDT